MKYKRNSGRPKSTKPDTAISKVIENTAIKQLESDVVWLEDLANTDQFSSEWVHKVAVELLFQCMGKKEIVIGNGEKTKLIRIFKEKPALEALAMIAKMNGHLFDVVKGSIKGNVTGEVIHKHVAQIEPDSNRTETVLDILLSCDALNPEIKRLTRDDVEIISA
jgi:hypothetical protein